MVLARGFVPCDILFIGEGPGDSEDVIGRPFEGPAGQLLDSAIHWAMDVDEWFVKGASIKLAMTNLVCCIPKEIFYDETEEYVTGVGKKSGEPDKYSIEACSPRLIEFHKIAKPKKVVLVGRLAEKHAPKYLDLPIDDTIAITHPAAILKSKEISKAMLYQRICVQLQELFEEFLEGR